MVRGYLINWPLCWLPSYVFVLLGIVTPLCNQNLLCMRLCSDMGGDNLEALDLQGRAFVPVFY
jgi:hypothetical protein